MYKCSVYKVILRKTFRRIHEISVLGGKLSAQYTKNNDWAESFLLNHKFDASCALRKKMSKMFESENDLLSTLEKHDQLIDDCASERISFSEFLEKYDTFYLTYALDGHESDLKE